MKAFGSQHYDHYNFLLTISDNLGGIGLEHHRSSENGVGRGYFTDWDNPLGERNLLPHEFSHSWDGKFRRGADLWTADYRTPMQDSLLWVYEGQTQFWGYVLGARSGMLSKQDTLDAIASTAAATVPVPPAVAGVPRRHHQRSNHRWANPASVAQPAALRGLLQRRPTHLARCRPHASPEVRREALDRRFRAAFFGIRDRDWGEVTYTLDDVAATLNGIQPYDWRGYLQRRVYDVAPQAPLEGINQGGYRLIFADEPTKWWRQGEKAARRPT